MEKGNPTEYTAVPPTAYPPSYPPMDTEGYQPAPPSQAYPPPVAPGPQPPPYAHPSKL